MLLAFPDTPEARLGAGLGQEQCVLTAEQPNCKFDLLDRF